MWIVLLILVKLIFWGFSMRLKVDLQFDETCSGKRQIANDMLFITNKNKTKNICQEHILKDHFTNYLL